LQKRTNIEENIDITEQKSIGLCIFYEFDEFEEKWYMRSKQVNWLQALYYMIQKRHRLKMTCPDCGSVFLALVKSFRKKIECPNCLE